MNLLSLAARDVRANPAQIVLAASLSAIAVALLTVVFGVTGQLSDRLERDARGIDLVVGAKGSPLQLVLAGVYHADVPPGNVPLEDVEALARNPMVRQVLPIALGDSFRGARIVGAPVAYAQLYGATPAVGRFYEEPLEAVLGADAAARLGLKPGDRFAGSHGLAEGGHQHEDMEYEVVGVLSSTGSVVDRLILTPIESVWWMHSEDAADDDFEAAREITVALVRYATPAAAVVLPRVVNQQTVLQAASPSFELARLGQLIGIGREVVQGLSALLLGAAAAALLMGLIASFRARRYELAVFRMLGASPAQLLGGVLLEGWQIATLGAAAGLCLGHAFIAMLSTWLVANHKPALDPFAFRAEEWGLVALSWAVGLIAAAWPAWRAYRLDVGETLARG